MSSTILIKNNKGGVGKSWITLQLAHAISKLKKSDISYYKVLILTSDSQNNILGFVGYDQEHGIGLEDWVLKGEGEIIRLKDNLEYIPLCKDTFSPIFREKLKSQITKFKTKYDYILIDSVPVLTIDKEFEELADSIIIPTFMDVVTLQGLNRILESINVKKVKAIVPNRFNGTSYEKKLLLEFQSTLNDTKIKLTSPIKQSALVSNLISKHKTIWESNSKKLEPIQTIFGEILEVIFNEK